jgi:hypothetical protein
LAKRSKKKKARLNATDKEWHSKEEHAADSSFKGRSEAWQKFMAAVSRKAG